MKLQFQANYFGPNVYLPVPATRWRLEDPSQRRWHSPASAVEFLLPVIHYLPGLRDRLERLQRLGDTKTSVEGKEGISLAEMVTYAAMELQILSRHPSDLFKLIPDANRTTSHIFCGHKEVQIGRISMETAFALIASLLTPGDETRQSLTRAMQAFHTRLEREALDQTTRAIVQAAERRGIPWSRLAPETRLVQLGFGRFSRRFVESMLDTEGYLAGRLITPDKSMTNRVVREAGLPAPRQFVVTDAGQAARTADRLGYPIVLKPLNGRKGHKVFVGLRDAAAVARTFEAHFKRGLLAIIEEFIPGDDHRLLVVGGKLIAAAKRIPGSVVGDGEHAIRQLVDQANKDPRRGLRFTNVLVRLELDETAGELLKAQGLNADSIPPSGQRVMLRKTANISTGGTALDVTDRVHPDVRRMAELTARTIGLEVAGIDFITPDIGRSHREVGGICEVNISPGLRPHWVAEGTVNRDVVNPILDLMFPPGQAHHVPIAAVTGTNGKTTTSHMLAHILQQAGRQVGLVSTLGARVNDWKIAEGDLAGPGAFKAIARNPETDAIVAEVARGALIKRGLGFLSCDVGAVLNVTTDHLGELGVGGLEEMAGVKEVVARAVTGTLVLNADDPLCLAMAQRAAAQQICLVTMEADCPALSAHVASGGRGARLIERDGHEILTLCNKDGDLEILPSADMPAAYGGAARHNLQNGLFAAALAQGMGLGVEEIRRGLADFRCDHESMPGRLNVFDGHPFKVILDYGHNPGGYRAVGPVVTSMAGDTGRRICVFTSPADRNDAHLVEIAEAAAPHFDHFIIREGMRHGSQTGTVPEKLQDALVSLGIPAERISLGGAPEAAVLAGLEMAEPGDVVYVMSTPNPAGGFWQLIENFRKDTSTQRTKT